MNTKGKAEKNLKRGSSSLNIVLPCHPASKKHEREYDGKNLRSAKVKRNDCAFSEEKVSILAPSRVSSLVEDPFLFPYSNGSPELIPGESAESFIRRLPPSKPSSSFCPFYWVRKDCGSPASSQSGEILPRNEAIELLNALWISIKNENKNLENLWSVCSHVGLDSIRGGKWMLFIKNSEVDQKWKTVVKGVISGKLGNTAKVTPASQGTNTVHLICVYTKDFRDVDDVNRVLKNLRNMGFEAGMSYKADAATHLHIYRDNQWGITPNFYYAGKHQCMAIRCKEKAKCQKNTLKKYFRKNRSSSSKTSFMK